MRKSMVLAAAMMLAPFAAASAQVCMGSYDIRTAPMNAGGRLGIHDNANSYSGQFGIHTRSNWFGQAGIGQLSIDGPGDLSSTLFEIQAGRQLTGLTLAQGKVKACPVGSFVYEDGEGYSSNLLKAGLALGGELSRGTQVSVRPTVGASLSRIGFSIDGVGDDSEIGLMLDLGVGFVFNKRIALVPSLNLPLGMDFAEESFLIAVSFAFGK